MRAWGSGLARKRAHSVPGSCRSALYFARPVTLSGPSTRYSSRPKMAEASGGRWVKVTATSAPSHSRRGDSFAQVLGELVHGLLGLAPDDGLAELADAGHDLGVGLHD